MTTNSPQLIDQQNLSLAWAAALLALKKARNQQISPLIVSFSGLSGGAIQETQSIRAPLDLALESNGDLKVHTVANTIFPESLWKRAKGDRQCFYNEYRANVQDYVALEPSKNSRGLYFNRLIDFESNPGAAKTRDKSKALSIVNAAQEINNQLEFVISSCKQKVRRSMFQAAVFDPRRDHTHQAQLSFPCLQHLTFVPDFPSGIMSVNAFYATQQIFVKGYGNYLGIARLGQFVASQVGLDLTRVTCFVGVAKMENKPRAGAALHAVIEACELATTMSYSGSAANDRK